MFSNFNPVVVWSTLTLIVVVGTIVAIITKNKEHNHIFVWGAFLIFLGIVCMILTYPLKELKPEAKITYTLLGIVKTSNGDAAIFESKYGYETDVCCVLCKPPFTRELGAKLDEDEVQQLRDSRPWATIQIISEGE